MPPSGINNFVVELFTAAGLTATAQSGVVTIRETATNRVLGEGRNIPKAIQAIKGTEYMKYGQVLGLAMAYAFGPEGVVRAVFDLQREAIDVLLDEEEEDSEWSEDGEVDEDDDLDEDEEDEDEDEDEDEEEDEDDEDEGDAYDDTQDIQEGRIRFVEDDE